MYQPTHNMRSRHSRESYDPVVICLLGRFQVLKLGSSVPIRAGTKTEALLETLAVQDGHTLAREPLLSALWPDSPRDLAGQSLNSLVYRLHKLLGDALGGAFPVECGNSLVGLNTRAGVAVDISRFEELMNIARTHRGTGDLEMASGFYTEALNLYAGELRVMTDDTQVLIKRERLRALHLDGLAALAEFEFSSGNYSACLEKTLRALQVEPCREDAHRLAMRCYMRLGNRAAALRQYRLCESVLQAEFGVALEPATLALYEQVRLAPDAV